MKCARSITVRTSLLIVFNHLEMRKTYGKSVLDMCLPFLSCDFCSKYCTMFRVLLERQLAACPGIRDK
jgi:hypothetical protein